MGGGWIIYVDKQSRKSRFFSPVFLFPYSILCCCCCLVTKCSPSGSSVLKYLPLIVLTEGRGEGDDRGQNGWMASLTWWTQYRIRGLLGWSWWSGQSIRHFWVSACCGGIGSKQGCTFFRVLVSYNPWINSISFQISLEFCLSGTRPQGCGTQCRA